MKFPKAIKDKLLSILVNRAVVFFFIMCVFTLFLYAIGTNQGFVDSTQLSLLKLYSVLAIFLAVMSIFGIIINVIRFLEQKKVRYLLRAGVYFLLALFGAATVLGAMFISALSLGN